ncbi:MAG: type II toxin-antitoxin system RelE/ParE family toxin [Planctomycetes bacterium]|nr:type II toxin-antitoxin system RelE/ParE family toxin [Planctomycetota bacterium]MBI3843993.1 type II toxin-antitoxin system RelE/ParE family toxin [Planctomycetota bacterium]
MKAQDKCRVRIERLAERGHELRRPEAAYVRDGIFEFRARHLQVSYRLAYFFHGPGMIVPSHGFAKQQDAVPDAEIERALTRMRRFTASPEQHTHEE